MMCTNGSTADSNAELHNAGRIVNTAFIFGLGECGQLPRHMCSNVDYIQEEPAAIDILPNNVDEVVCGSMHTIVKTKDDKLFSFGCNDMGVLGRVTKDSGNPKEAEDFPNIINFDFPDKIKKITCGDNHTAVLLQNGKVYITGGFRDNGGVLGIPSFKKENEIISNTFHFLEVKFSFSMTPTSASSETSISPINKDISVLQNGDIAAENSGTSDLKNELVNITDIASGEDHLICVDASREYIYTIGNSDSCQVLNKFYDSEESETYRYKYLFPKCYHYNKDLSFETKIEKIFCGGNNTFVQVHSKEVYAIGRNAYGSCGVSSNENVIKKFQKIPILSNKEIKQLCGGQTFTVCLLANNDLYIWGNREMLMGELEEDAYEPIQLNFFKDKNIQIKNVSCGTDHCLVLAEDGKLYAWGYGGNCFNLQKAVGALESKMPMEIKYLEYFKDIVENPKVDAQHFLSSIKIQSLSGGSAHCTFILSHLDERHQLLKRSREAAELENDTATLESIQKKNAYGNEEAEADDEAVLGKRAKFETDDSYDQVKQDFEVEDLTKEEEFSEVLSDHKKITTSSEMVAQSAEDKEREEKVFSENEKEMFNGTGVDVVKGVVEEEDVSRGSATEDQIRAESVTSIPVVKDSESEALKIEELQGEGEGEERSAVEEAYLKSEEELGTDVDAATEEKGELFHSAYSEVEQKSPTVPKENYLSTEKDRQKEEEGLMSDFSKREEEQQGKEGEGLGVGEIEGEIKGESVKRTKSARSKPVVNVESPVRKQPRRSCKENIVTLNENEIVKQYQHVEQMISKKSSSYKYRKTKSATINKKENSKSKRKSAGRTTVSAGAGRSKKKVAAPPANEKKKVKEETTHKKGKTIKGKEVVDVEAEAEEAEKETENVEKEEGGGGEEEEKGEEGKKVSAKGKKRESKSKVKKESAETEEKEVEQKKAKKNEKEKEKGKEHGTEKEKEKDKKKEKEKEKEKEKDNDKEKEKEKEKGKKKERKSKALKEEVPTENEAEKEEEEQVNEPEKDKDKKRKRESKKKDSFSRENLKRESFSAAEEKMTKSKSSKFKH